MKYQNINWLADNDYKKAVFHLRGQFNEAFRGIRQQPNYGLGVYLDEGIEKALIA